MRTIHKLDIVIDIFESFLRNKTTQGNNIPSYNDNIIYCKLPQNIDDFIAKLDDDNYPIYLFSILTVNPKNPNYMNIQYTLESKEDKSIKEGYPHHSSNLLFQKNAIELLLQLLNISCFIDKNLKSTDDKILEKNFEIKITLMDIFLIIAANEFEKMFTLRDKNKFAFYFWKILTAESWDSQITRYKTDSWRTIFNEKKNNFLKLHNYYKKNNLYIKSSTKNIESKSFCFGNLVLTIGEMTPKSKNDLSIFIEIGCSNHKQDYTRLIITDFSPTK